MNTYKYFLFFIGLLFLASCNLKDNEDKSDKVSSPNILWITCEDMSPHLGCYGDSVVQTPVLDSLARLGVRYTNVFSVSGVCAPSRAALITGMYPTAIGAQHMRTVSRTSALDKISDPELLAIPVYEAVPPPEVKCFTEYLRAEGYYCTNNSKTDYQFRKPITAWDESSDTAHWRNRAPGQPFFSVFNITTTHESQVWRRANEPLTVDPKKVDVPPYYPDSPIIRRDIARHYSNIEIMDTQVSKILNQLDNDGLTDSTIIFFYSDHGDGLPRAKRWIYDSGLKVPLIIKYPDQRNAGTVDDQLISFVDFAPTVLSLVSVAPPAYMQGQAFLGKYKTSSQRNYIFAAKDRMDPAIDCRRTVRDNRYKYIRNYMPEKPYVQFLPYRDQMDLMQELFRFEKEGKLNNVQQLFFRKTKPKEEFYDTWNDRHEINNLADEPGYDSIITKYRKRLDEWIDMTGDPLLLPETELVKKMWPPEGNQPQTKKVHFENTDEHIILKCDTEGASIAYQKNEEIGSTHWNLYINPVSATALDSIKAVAIRIGYKESEPAMYNND